MQLVTIDPITAYMGSGRGFDSHRATDVRSQLLPLAKLAEKVNISFSAVTHPPKSATARTAIDSFIGSQAFVAASRIAHYCIGELGEEDDRGRRRPTGRVLFASVRGSHSAPMPTLAYHIETVRIGWDAKRGRDIIVPRIIWRENRLTSRLTTRLPPTERNSKTAAKPRLRRSVSSCATSWPMARCCRRS